MFPPQCSVHSSTYTHHATHTSIPSLLIALINHLFPDIFDGDHTITYFHTAILSVVVYYNYGYTLNSE